MDRKDVHVDQAAMCNPRCQSEPFPRYVDLPIMGLDQRDRLEPHSPSTHTCRLPVYYECPGTAGGRPV